MLGLFLAKRLGGQLPIVLALPGLRLMTGATKTNIPSPYVQTQSNDPSAGQIALGLALMTGGVAYMFIHNAPYSRRSLSAAHQLPGRPPYRRPCAHSSKPSILLRAAPTAKKWSAGATGKLPPSAPVYAQKKPP